MIEVVNACPRGFPSVGQLVSVRVRSISYDGIYWGASILGVTKSHDPGNARAADGYIGPLAASLLTKHVIEWEDAGSGNGEGLRALRTTVWIVCNDDSICGVHDEIVGVVRDDMNSILSGGITAHIKIAVVTDREVVSATGNKWTVPGGEVATSAVARPGNDRVDR